MQVSRRVMTVVVLSTVVGVSACDAVCAVPAFAACPAPALEVVQPTELRASAATLETDIDYVMPVSILVGS